LSWPSEPPEPRTLADELQRETDPALPSFIGIGPGRTGTTWLHDALSKAVCLPLIKETTFFSLNWDRGIDWYRNLFRHRRPDQIAGEVCPYFSWPGAAERIRKVLPNCKIICTLRDPVARAHSQYKMARCNLFVRGTIDDAIERNPRMIEAGRYATHLPHWFRIFGRENVLVTDFDDLRSDPQRYLDSVCDFVGVARLPLAISGVRKGSRNTYDRAPRSRRIAQNARHLKFKLIDRGFHRTFAALERAGIFDWCAGRGVPFPPLTAEQDSRLREIFRPEIDGLEDLLGRDFSKWRIPRNGSTALV